MAGAIRRTPTAGPSCSPCCSSPPPRVRRPSTTRLCPPWRGQPWSPAWSSSACKRWERSPQNCAGTDPEGVCPNNRLSGQSSCGDSPWLGRQRLGSELRDVDQRLDRDERTDDDGEREHNRRLEQGVAWRRAARDRCCRTELQLGSRTHV